MLTPTAASFFTLGALGLILSPVMSQEKITIGQNGKTDYVIYHDINAPRSLQNAASDLASYFQKSAGFSPKIVASATPPKSPYISLGNTPAARAAGVDASKIASDGFRIAVHGRNVFISGRDTVEGEITTGGGIATGTANGIYSFCEEYLGMRWLLPGDLGEEIPQRAKVTLPAKLDRSEAPLFNYRSLPYIGKTKATDVWAMRLKVDRSQQFSKVVHGHNWAETIPAALYEKHPEWFAEINGKRQFPTGRYKLETTNPELVQAFADKVIAAFAADANLKWYSLSPSDGGGWSESAASKALYDKDPHGKVSVTPLVLKFYNDVAKIVGDKFPDRKLGGYIYADYLYPPSNGIPKLEPNLALTVAASISYGYQLYRPTVQADWDKLVRAWGEAARASGSEIYYYDLPTYFKQTTGVITPPAPEILNFVFSRLAKYGYRGAYIYGVEGWPQSGPMNYALAKLLWNPKANAKALCNEYYRAAYGDAAAPHIAAIYQLLDDAFHAYYNRHLDASYNLTPEFLTEIYGPKYHEIEAHFLKAQAAATQPKQKSRLRFFAQILSLMQWNLKANGALPADYQSALTLPDEKIDEIFAKPNKDFNIAPAAIEMKPESVGWRAELSTPATTLPAPSDIPTRSNVRLLLYAPQSGEVSIVSKTLVSRGEFVTYTLFDAQSNQALLAGALRAGRVLRFPAQAGKTYRLDVANSWSSLRLEVQGAVAAYKANALGRGFRIEAYALENTKTPLAFHVPAGGKGFNLAINGSGVSAEVFAPSGRSVGTIDSRSTPVARLQVAEADATEGFWKIVFDKPSSGEKIVYLVLDASLPQWIFPDPACTLKIISQM
jgi:hypothetical protein